jgi:PAS domain S-box-containing protein
MENGTTKASILVVDDSPDNLRLLTKILKDDAYHVRAAKNGLEALASVSAELPDLVLLDIKMPDMSGYEVCRRLKADDASKNIPVIFISALDAIDDKKKGFEAGCSDFITKPFQREELLARVSAHVDISRMRINLEQRNSDIQRFNEKLQFEINEHERIAKSLRESEEKFKLIFDNASDGLILTDIENKNFHDANKSMCRMLEYSFEELVKLKVMDIHPEEELPHILGKINEQIKKPLAAAEDIKMKKKDGSIFYANVSGSLLSIAGKKYALGVFRDVTERRRAEVEREKKLLWLQNINLIRQSLLATAPLEKKLKIMTDAIVKVFNADFCRIWLIRPGDMCDNGCIHAGAMERPHACTHKDKCLHLMSSSGRYTHTDGKVHQRVPFGCYKIGLIASGEEHKLLTNDVRNDPRVHDNEWARELGLVSFAGYQLKIPGGDTLGVLALFAGHEILPDEDAMLDGLGSTASFVIQQAMADDELRENEEKYRTLFEDSQDALLVLDTDLKRFTSCNTSSLKMFGMKKAEELFLSGPLALSPEWQPDGRLSAEKFVEMFETVLREGHHFFEWTHKRASGEEFAATVLLTRIIIKNKVLIQSTIRDVSARKLMEKILKENKLKSQFIENMSHEIRTPINGIMGYIQLLSYTGLNTEQKEYVENAMICNNNLLNIVNDILDFSTFEKETIEIRQNEFNISNLVKEAVTPFGLLAKEKSILLNYSVSDKIPKIVVGDKLRILQILQKLLDNAVKFTSAGKIDITIEETSRNADSISLKFCVSDTGIGIAENCLKELFKPFVQLDMSTTKKYCGTGLGLAITRKLIEVMGGCIEVISKPGEGSNFIFELKLGIV